MRQYQDLIPKIELLQIHEEVDGTRIRPLVATMRGPPPTLSAYNQPSLSWGHVETTCSPDWHEMPAERINYIMMEVAGGGEGECETYSVTSPPKPDYAKWGEPGAVEHLQFIARISSSCWRYYR